MKPLFEEKQRYSQWWLWLIISSAAAGVVGVFVNALVQQLVLGIPWGDDPISDDALVGLSLYIITAMVVMLLIFFNSVLEVSIDKNSLTYRYFPLIRKWRRIERESIEAFEMKKHYFKGYGVKRDFRGNRSVTVKGHTAIEITMHDGKRLMIGTQRPGEFLDALNKMKKRSDELSLY